VPDALGPYIVCGQTGQIESMVESKGKRNGDEERPEVAMQAAIGPIAI
jgi:hypothetical protein